MQKKESEHVFDEDMVIDADMIIDGDAELEEVQMVECVPAINEVQKVSEEVVNDFSYEVVKETKIKKAGFGGFSFGLGKKKKEKISPELKGQEPYLKLTEMYGTMKMPQCHGTDIAKMSVRNLMEKLRNESPFGQGKEAVILCENEIAACLNEIAENIDGLFDDAIAKEASEVIVINCKTVQAKLKVRTELKKK